MSTTRRMLLTCTVFRGFIVWTYCSYIHTEIPLPASSTFLHFASEQRNPQECKCQTCGFWGIFSVPASVLSALRSILACFCLNHFRRLYFYYLQNVLIIGKMKYELRTTDPLQVHVLCSNDALKFSPTSFTRLN